MGENERRVSEKQEGAMVTYKAGGRDMDGRESEIEVGFVCKMMIYGTRWFSSLFSTSAPTHQSEGSQPGTFFY